MQTIRFIILCTLLCFVRDITASSIWKKIFSPSQPPLRKVRNLDEARSTDDHVVLDFIGLVQRHSYPAEEHNVTTEDGYRLLIHRIPGSPHAKNTKGKKVVYLQHGVIASSDTWVLMGPGNDLAFELADKGYDVWLGNFRGNTYSKSHVRLNATQPEFWQFSFHEKGIYDLPAVIDYILEHTGQPSLYYIGHSMGTTTSYVLLSMRPEYNEKINLVVSLSPVAFWNHGVSPVLKFLFNNVPAFKKIFDSNDIYEFAPQSVAYAKVVETFCKDSSLLQPICTELIFALSGRNTDQFNSTLLPYFFSYYPAGSPTQNLYHYHQNYVTGKFQAYDYGYAENYVRYNQKTSPEYDLKKITSPQALFYGANDGIVLPENAIEVAKHLPNVAVVEKVRHECFTHVDFIWARDAKEILYDRVLEVMQDY